MDIAAMTVVSRVAPCCHDLRGHTVVRAVDGISRNISLMIVFTLVGAVLFLAFLS